MNDPSQDEIDIKGLLLTLWADRKTIFWGATAAFFLSTFYAFVIAKPTFVSSALLVPTEQPSADQMSAAAALLGKKTMGMGDLDLYQSLLTSRVVLGKLLTTPMRNEHDTAKGRIEPLFQIMKLDTSDRIGSEKTLESLADEISVGSKETGDGGILEVSVGARHPWLAQQMCDFLLRIGQIELISVRRERYSALLASLEEAVHGAKSEWDTIAAIHANFKEKNRINLLPLGVLELSKLEMEKSAKEQKYLLARREFETQQLERAKAAPPMVILDPANLPAKKAKPKRLFLMAIGLILGSVLSAFFAIAKAIFSEEDSESSCQAS